MNKPLLDLPTILQEHIHVAEASTALLPALARISEATVTRLRQGGKLFFCGNGGSAADAQHFAAELIGRFYLERRAIAAIALTTDSSILTCLGNDYGYDVIFSRQLEALCNASDVVMLITTSGNSANILKAAEMTRTKGAYTIALTGKDGGAIQHAVDE